MSLPYPRSDITCPFLIKSSNTLSRRLPRLHAALDCSVERRGGNMIPANKHPPWQLLAPERAAIPPPMHIGGDLAPELPRLGIRYRVCPLELPPVPYACGVVREPRRQLGPHGPIEVLRPALVRFRRLPQHADAAEMSAALGRVGRIHDRGEADAVDGIGGRVAVLPHPAQDDEGIPNGDVVSAGVVQARHLPLGRAGVLRQFQEAEVVHGGEEATGGGGLRRDHDAAGPDGTVPVVFGAARRDRRGPVRLRSEGRDGPGRTHLDALGFDLGP
mmetsp:Transcript_19968/g.40460  ORF Transcript_19968/g.40460 Transcript_19968/m.40460 type:complete len:273 (-) Transcript_19968:688-1506(-)